MIIRIVQMTFQEEKVQEFLDLFEERKQLIRAFNGCNHLELWQDTQNPQIMFTYSFWETEEHLDHYRFSAFFKDTWRRTRILFANKPEARSLVQKAIVNP